jgi:RNA polymerase sigma-32 factor
VSLNMPASEREDGPQHDMIDNLACSEDGPEEQVIKHDQTQFLRQELRAALNTSGAREQFVLEARFLDEAPPTLAELGTVLNVSREYIRQLEQQGLKKLKTKLRHIKKKTV